MKTRTELQIEYAYLSWDYEFPGNIEIALENDYVKNPHVYSKGAFLCAATLLLIAPDASPEHVLYTVRSFTSGSATI